MGFDCASRRRCWGSRGGRGVLGWMGEMVDGGCRRRLCRTGGSKFCWAQGKTYWLMEIG